ncbi:antitoxin [Cupriavidus plantarum]|uniref:antitoxin n=1 Tax=Cupriavidus plantarum TaxID=942865 RepID=UPI0038B2DB66
MPGYSAMVHVAEDHGQRERYLPVLYTYEDAVQTAKLFMSGRSQAVRLPKEFRFEGTEVSIRKRGNAVILEAVAENWSWLEHVCGPVDSDLEQAALERL